MDSLAAPSDVEEFLGRSLTTDEAARCEAILRKASALFRREARQDFTVGESTVRRKVNGGEVVLPQSPVREIWSVTDDRGRDVSYSLRGQILRVPLTSSEFVLVEYEHGAETVPELVKDTVAEIAKKVLSISPNAVSGLTQAGFTAGPMSSQETYATWAQGGQTMLAPDDLATARSFRVRSLNVWVQDAPAGIRHDLP